MYGTNPIAKARNPEEGFLVHSIFYTIQGEGPFAGQPAIFLRLAGCNLRCVWCDTEFDDNAEEVTAVDLIAKLRGVMLSENCNFIVITGGEPMLQPLRLIIDNPFMKEASFQIETAGTVWPNNDVTATMLSSQVSVVVSPKTPLVHPRARTSINLDVYWKYIIRAADLMSAEDGLPMSSTQGKEGSFRLFRPALPVNKQRIFVQACDEGDDAINKKNLALAAKIAMKYGYRLSVQLHKVAGLD